MLKVIFFLLIIMGSIVSANDTEPPAGLTRAQTPVFLSFGIDDNRFVDGMEWMLNELFKDRVNPAGMGNPATYDGTPVRATFFVIGNAGHGETWRKLYDEGFEIGGHTWTHSFAMYDLDYTQSLEEIFPTNKYLVNTAGIPQSHIIGFRTPFLAHSVDVTTFSALKFLGYRYDCSMAASGIGAGTYLEGDSHFPRPMDNGFLFANNIIVPGFWQLPFYVMATNKPTNAPFWFESLDSMWSGASVGGFDSNFWPTRDVPRPNTSASDFLQYLKWTLDASIRGNRAPVDIGLHSDYYSHDNTGTRNFSSTVEQRRQALIDFLDYAQSKPDVRIVPKADVLRWMYNPVALDDLSQKERLENFATNQSENLAATPNISITTDSRGSIGSRLNTSTASLAWDWSLAQPSPDLYTNPDNRVDANIDFLESATGLEGIKIVYRSDSPVRIRFKQDGLSDNHAFITEFPSSPNSFTTQTVRLDVITVSQLPNSETATFDPSKVNGIAITPVLLDAPGNGITEIEELVFFGTGPLVGGDVSTTATAYRFNNNQLAVKGLKRGVLSFSVPENGTYTISVYNVNGRLLTQRSNVSLKAGIQNLTIPEATGSGVRIVRIAGNDHVITSQLISR
ncbi:polysaccharide deacetylase [Chitinispirillum alkaliphilum]|nr:polysaccharide deacetylase [Chitinispirillum alkaliphilum]